MLLLLEPLNYILVAAITAKSQQEICAQIVKMLAVINHQGFTVANVKTDGEPALRALAPILVRLHDLEVDRLGTGDHASKAERAIRSIKERCRSILHSLPYRLPLFLYPALVTHVIKCINFIPRQGETTSPYMRFYGFKPDFKLLKHVFGSYGMLHPSNTDNTMRARSTHGILLYSSDSTNGSVYCFNLETQGIT
jgi:hypothetical protein